ncbi:hypothetical protein PG993_004462 [Apiospora rasikravindrae]|uniref:Ankyrin n=1 Tax=Apiospora rasikravindrae TaxID=990691 RepID=A0ABR1TCX5_9PEZI
MDHVQYILPHPPPTAASREAALSRVRTLLDRGDLLGAQTYYINDPTNLTALEFYQAVLRSWSRSDQSEAPDRWETLFDLVRYAFGIYRFGWAANELLCEASRYGYLGLLRRLLNPDSPFHECGGYYAPVDGACSKGCVEDISRQFHQSVGEAVLADSLEAVRFLLDQPGIGPHFRHRNNHDCTVFHMASLKCNPAIMELLLSRLSSLMCVDEDGGDEDDGDHEGDGDDGKEQKRQRRRAGLINQISKDGNTALAQFVISSPQNTAGRLQCIELLLVRGEADPSLPRDQVENRPLTKAAVLGDLEIIRLLTRWGSDDVDSGTIVVPVEDEDEKEVSHEEDKDIGAGGERKKMRLKFHMVEDEELLPDAINLLS